MLKKVVLALVILGIPLVAYTAYQYGRLEKANFAKAKTEASGRSETEIEKKLEIEAEALVDAEHPVQNQDGNISFFARDADNHIFNVGYSGPEDAASVRNGQKLSLIGHASGSGEDFFHAHQLIIH